MNNEGMDSAHKPERAAIGIADAFVRLAVGTESIDGLVADGEVDANLKQAPSRTLGTE